MLSNRWIKTLGNLVAILNFTMELLSPMESREILKTALQLFKNGNWELKKPFLRGVRTTPKFKYKILGKAGEMVVHFLESSVAFYQVGYKYILFKTYL